MTISKGQSLLMKTKIITSFYFNKASYWIEDNFGNKILLKINYFDNKFDLKTKKQKDANIALLQYEVKKIAKDLLNRKHNINFAK